MMTVERGYVHEVQFQSIAKDGKPARDLAKLRVNIDRSYREGENEDGTASYNRDRDFWINVELWGARSLALRGIVDQGARVILVGRYDNSTWTDRESGEQKSRMIFVASQVAINPDSVESITYRKKGGGDAASDRAGAT